MAGSQRKKDPDLNQGKKCGENITGHIYKCACCLQNCPPLAPDNCTMIPVCIKCWGQIGATNKLMIVAFTRNTKAIEGLTHMIQEYLGNRGIYVGRIRPERPGEGN